MATNVVRKLGPNLCFDLSRPTQVHFKSAHMHIESCFWSQQACWSYLVIITLTAHGAILQASRLRGSWMLQGPRAWKALRSWALVSCFCDTPPPPLPHTHTPTRPPPALASSAAAAHLLR